MLTTIVAQNASIAKKRRNGMCRIPAVTYTDFVGDDGITSMGFVSPQMEAILGFPPQRFLDDAGFWFDQMHPDDLAHLRSIDAFNNADFEVPDLGLERPAVDTTDVENVIRLLEPAERPVIVAGGGLAGLSEGASVSGGLSKPDADSRDDQAQAALAEAKAAKGAKAKKKK